MGVALRTFRVALASVQGVLEVLFCQCCPLLPRSQGGEAGVDVGAAGVFAWHSAVRVARCL